MYLTPEEIQRKKKRNKLLINFIVIPAVAILVGVLVALLGANI